MSAAPFDDLITGLAEEAALKAKVDLLLAGVAERMVAASNDQNVQRLARALRAAAPAIASAVCAAEGSRGIPA